LERGVEEFGRILKKTPVLLFSFLPESAAGLSKCGSVEVLPITKSNPNEVRPNIGYWLLVTGYFHIFAFALSP
jgi:hypothetical protein